MSHEVYVITLQKFLEGKRIAADADRERFLENNSIYSETTSPLAGLLEEILFIRKIPSTGDYYGQFHLEGHSNARTIYIILGDEHGRPKWKYDYNKKEIVPNSLGDPSKERRDEIQRVREPGNGGWEQVMYFEQFQKLYPIRLDVDKAAESRRIFLDGTEYQGGLPLNPVKRHQLSFTRGHSVVFYLATVGRVRCPCY